MRALVTGGAGFVGRHLVRGLADAGWTVDVVDIAARPPGFAASLGYRRGSVLDSVLMDGAIGGADLVIHLAGIAEPMRYGSDPLGTMDVNLFGAIDVAKGCARHGRPLLFASTSEIYGANPDLPWSEDADRVLGAVANVRWCYATAKAAAEHYIDALRRQEGLTCTVVRLFNAYGPGLNGRVVDSFIKAALAGHAIDVHGDGSQTRCFCYIDDVVDALLRICAAPLQMGATYNVGVDTETSIAELARRVIDLAQSTSPLRLVPYGDLYTGFQDVARRRPDTAAIRRDLGWTPRTSLDDGLRRMLESARLERARAI